MARILANLNPTASLGSRETEKADSELEQKEAIWCVIFRDENVTAYDATPPLCALAAEIPVKRSLETCSKMSDLCVNDNRGPGAELGTERRMAAVRIALTPRSAVEAMTMSKLEEAEQISRGSSPAEHMSRRDSRSAVTQFAVTELRTPMTALTVGELMAIIVDATSLTTRGAGWTFSWRIGPLGQRNWLPTRNRENEGGEFPRSTPESEKTGVAGVWPPSTHLESWSPAEGRAAELPASDATRESGCDPLAKPRSATLGRGEQQERYGPGRATTLVSGAFRS
ncbi:unnamed protein product [Linum trigynum]|uniref:Uncharacterized protein n=1 Tax=Linum trigynum TaxID=586398 RepID=A0AAV2FBR4_9ROSI